MSNTVDYGTDAEPAPQNIVARLDHLAQMAEHSEKNIEELEKQLEAEKARWRDIVDRQLVEAMEEARVSKGFRTTSGLELELKHIVRATVTPERKADAYKLVREKGSQAVIKTTLTIEFEAGRDIAARGIKLILAAIGQNQKLQDVMTSASFLDPLSITEVLAGLAFLRAVSNEAEDRLQLSSNIHTQTFAALIRRWLEDGKVSPDELEPLGIFIQKQAKVKRAK